MKRCEGLGRVHCHRCGSLCTVSPLVSHMLRNAISLRQHTDMASQDGNPTSFDAASRSMVWYTERMCFGAATVSGRANRALISALSAGESFDMMLMILHALFKALLSHHARRCFISTHMFACRG